MSELLAEAEAALAYEAPAESPAVVLAVAFGQEVAAPDPIDTVEALWEYEGRPGTFTTRVSYRPRWRESMDAALRLDVFEVETLYNLLGGWPEPTPIPELPPPPGVFRPE